MTDAETILKMIETVGLSDKAKLDEIDARVYCYLNDMDFLELGYGNSTFRYRDVFGIDYHSPLHTKYTRDRNALKAIRPDGWYFHMGENDGFHCMLQKNGMEKMIFQSEAHQTEELAELHAIIQAIDYERRTSKDNLNN